MGDDYRLAAILAADVDGFEAMASRGERTALRVAELVAGLLERRALELGGALKSSSGATFIVEFPSALKAVQCALRVREATESQALVQLRVGVHLGDIWFFGNEALGEGVEIAMRLRSLAAPGAIVLSGDVYRQVEGRIEARPKGLGAIELKGLGHAVEAFEIDGKAEGAAAPAVAPQPDPEDPVPRLRERIPDRLRTGGDRFGTGAIPAAVQRLFPSFDPPQGPLRQQGPGREADEPEEIEAEREAARTGAFRAHLAAYGAVSALLLLVWFVTTKPFGHPWFLYPVGGWAVGVAHHFVATVTGRAQRREMRARLSAEQRRTLRRLHRAESGFAHHLTSFGTVTGFLFMVNMITLPGFPWFVFPSAGWTVGLVSHRLFFRVRRKSLLQRLRRLGVVRGELARVRGAALSAGRFGPLIDEANNIKESLLRQIQGSEPLRTRFGAELEPLLERYLGQINGLNERSRELEALLSTLSVEQIDAEIERLRAGREAARSPSVRAEYDRALTQHEHQRESLEELRGQQEILDLRIKGSVLALKRIEMDVARMKGLETSQVMGSLKEKSEELSRYLEDLKAGYSELEG